MMIIAAGPRQVHPDNKGNRYVLFDGGVYPLESGAKVSREGGKEWIECEAHADEATGEAYAVIGGKQMEYIFTADSPIEPKGSGKGSPKDDDEPTEEGAMKLEHVRNIIRNELRRNKLKRR